MSSGLFSVTHIDAAATFADAMSNFADECASLPAMPIVTEHSTARAWALTGLIVAADAGDLETVSKQTPPPPGRRSLIDRSYYRAKNRAGSSPTRIRGTPRISPSRLPRHCNHPPRLPAVAKDARRSPPDSR